MKNRTAGLIVLAIILVGVIAGPQAAGSATGLVLVGYGGYLLSNLLRRSFTDVDAN